MVASADPTQPPEGFRPGAQHFLVGSFVFSFDAGSWCRWDTKREAFVPTDVDWDASTPGLVPVSEDDALARIVTQVGDEAS